MWLCLATAIICFDFAAFCFSGGREFFCWACVNFLFGLSRLMFLFHDGLAQFFALVGISGFPGGLWQFFVRGGDRELFC